MFGTAHRSVARFAPVGALSGDQPGYSDQIIGDEIGLEDGADAGDSSLFRSSQAAVLLAPAEDAFDHLAPGLRLGVAGMAGGARVDGVACPLKSGPP